VGNSKKQSSSKKRKLKTAQECKEALREALLWPDSFFDAAGNLSPKAVAALKRDFQDWQTGLADPGPKSPSRRVFLRGGWALDWHSRSLLSSLVKRFATQGYGTELTEEQVHVLAEIFVRGFLGGYLAFFALGLKRLQDLWQLSVISSVEPLLYKPPNSAKKGKQDAASC